MPEEETDRPPDWFSDTYVMSSEPCCATHAFDSIAPTIGTYPKVVPQAIETARLGVADEATYDRIRGTENLGGLMTNM